MRAVEKMIKLANKIEKKLHKFAEIPELSDKYIENIVNHILKINSDKSIEDKLMKVWQEIYRVKRSFEEKYEKELGYIETEKRADEIENSILNFVKKTIASNVSDEEWQKLVDDADYYAQQEALHEMEDRDWYAEYEGEQGEDS